MTTQTLPSVPAPATEREADVRKYYAGPVKEYGEAQLRRAVTDALKKLDSTAQVIRAFLLSDSTNAQRLGLVLARVHLRRADWSRPESELAPGLQRFLEAQRHQRATQATLAALRTPVADNLPPRFSGENFVPPGLRVVEGIQAHGTREGVETDRDKLVNRMSAEERAILMTEDELGEDHAVWKPLTSDAPTAINAKLVAVREAKRRFAHWHELTSYRDDVESRRRAVVRTIRNDLPELDEFLTEIVTHPLGTGRTSLDKRHIAKVDAALVEIEDHIFEAEQERRRKR